MKVNPAANVFVAPLKWSSFVAAPLISIAPAAPTPTFPFIVTTLSVVPKFIVPLNVPVPETLTVVAVVPRLKVEPAAT